MADSQPETMTTKDKMEELLLDGPPYLDEQKPYLTVNDLAEALEVTKATVRNNAPKVATHPLIDTDSVGQATVYYRAFEPSEEWGEAMDGN
ncbi:hypothetical protein ACOZ4F_19970, partial [Haloarcula marismortui]|uniref:hypothetical protein n=1 Tax=Haloarcula marismortui TaxID=2238 RepID=UPI003C745CB0